MPTAPALDSSIATPTARGGGVEANVLQRGHRVRELVCGFREVNAVLAEKVGCAGRDLPECHRPWEVSERAAEAS